MATLLSVIRQTVRERLMEEVQLVTPGAPNVSPQGTPGSSTISYKIVAKNADGTSDASQAKTITNAAATLNGTNYNQLTWTAVPGETAGYDIYRTATNGVSPTTIGLIGSVATGVLTFNDDGDAGNAAVAPTVNTSGVISPFWTDAELLQIIVLGCKDLWRAIVDLHKGHFTTVDPTSVTLTANTATLTGVPADVFRILSIEPADLTSSAAHRNTSFIPRAYQSRSFQAARSGGVLSPTTGGVIVYDILNAGSPVLAPSIVIAPMVSATITLRLVYVHTLSSTLNEEDNNPIPGESDNALISWAVAWARAKEREDRSPDPAWIATYSTDKQSLLTALTPRQEQEEEVVEDLFGDLWN